MATSQFTDATQILGSLKQVYADKIKDLRLKVAIAQTEVPFKESQLVSDKYHQPVVLTHNHGLFCDVSGGSRTMPDNPVAMQTQDLQVPAFEITERLRIPFGTIASLETGNAASFFDTQMLKLLSVQKAEIRDVEWALLYGKLPIAKVTAIGSWGSNKATLTLDHASISDALLAGMENAPLDAYDTSTGTTLLNSNLACTVVSVSLDNTSGGSPAPQIVISNTNGSDQTALTNQATPWYLFRRSTVGFEMPGLIYQAQNTGSLFGVTYSDYSLLQAVQNTAVGQPNMAAMLALAARAQSRGLEEDVEVWISPKGFNNAMVDIAALRRIGGGDYNPGKLQNGAKAVEFFCQSGALRLVSHPFMKNGDLLGVAPSNLARIGAKDITDNLAGLDLSVMQGSNNAFEFRLFTNQAIVNIAPAQSFLGTGVTLAKV